MVRVLLFGEESAGLQAARLVADSGATLVGIGTTLMHRDRVTPLAALAAQLNVPAWSPAQIRDPAFAAIVHELDAHLLLNVHSLVLLPAEVLRAPTLGAFNLHPGPLPRYAGLSCPSWAILHGESTYGVTVHRMVPEVDAGNIVYAADVPVTPRMTGLALSMACIRAGLPLVRRLLEAARTAPAELIGRPQAPHDRRVFPRRPAGGCRLEWSLSAAEIDRLVRAADYAPFTSPWGAPQTALGDATIGVLKAEATTIRSAGAPGTVGESEGDAVLVSASDYSVRVQRVLHAGAARPAASVLHPGTLLGESTLRRSNV